MRPNVRRMSPAVATVLLIGGLLAGCGDDDGAGTGDEVTDGADEADGADGADGADATGDVGEDVAAEVDIIDNGFEPDELAVSVGDHVTWTNTGSSPHTVTFDDGPDSGSIPSGETFSHTFEEAGAHTYACAIHPAMTGTVDVTG